VVVVVFAFVFVVYLDHLMVIDDQLLLMSIDDDEQMMEKIVKVVEQQLLENVELVEDVDDALIVVEMNKETYDVAVELTLDVVEDLVSLDDDED
jgi:hypothetical protein